MAAAGHASPSQLPGRDMDGDQPRDSIPAVEATPPALGDVTTAIIPRHEPFSIPPVTEEPDEISGSGAGFSCEMGGINEAEHDCSAKGSCRPRRSSTHHSIISRRQSTANSLRQQSTSSGVDSQAPDVEADDSSVDTGALNHEQKLKKLRRQDLDDYEEQLLDCIVNIDAIRPNYADIFIDSDVVRKLEGVTTMSMDRKQAFSSGVLRNNRVTGAVLYGPPGTGKSLLARGISKQSGFNMLAVSTAEIWQTCWGEDEKVIKAVFSLARKLYPCIIFMDEADAMFGARKGGEKKHVRAMLNCFLMEWDGILTGETSPFVLLATNRPFDLDPAVLRRAPFHIHLDIPTFTERKGILDLLLREEELHSIDTATLAKMTSSYTGSDLKNLCVTAAVNCVGEQEMDTSKRVLRRRHFMLAMKSVRPTGLGRTLKSEFQNFEKKGVHQELPPEEE